MVVSFMIWGASFVRNVRTIANSVVWKGKQYMSHYLSPLLSCKILYEPYFWTVQRCFQSFLRACCLQLPNMEAV